MNAKTTVVDWTDRPTRLRLIGRRLHRYDPVWGGPAKALTMVERLFGADSDAIRRAVTAYCGPEADRMFPEVFAAG